MKDHRLVKQFVYRERFTSGLLFWKIFCTQKESATFFKRVLAFINYLI